MNIRTRVTLVAVTAVLAVSMALSWVGYRSFEASESRYVDATLNAKSALWQQIVNRHAERLGSLTRSLTRDRVMLKALRARDRSGIQEQIDTLFNNFSAQGALDRVQVVDTSGQILAAETPGHASGTTHKISVQQAIAEKKQIRTVDVDDDGQLQLVAAFPLHHRGKLQGIGVLSKDLQPLADDFQQDDGGDIYVVSNNRQHTVSAQGNGAATAKLPSSGTTGLGWEVRGENGRYIALAAVPVVNIRGETIANLASVADQTDIYSAQAQSRRTAIGIVLVGILLSALGLYWYFKRIFRPIEQVVHCMGEISKGALTCPIPEHRSDDETGRLTQSLRTMVLQLHNLLEKIAGASGDLIASTTRLASISDQASNKSAEQKTETRSVATSIQELAASIQEVAGGASRAAESAGIAANRAESGQQAVTLTISAIRELVDGVETVEAAITRLTNDSQRIGSVIDVIRDIADQTNLLALNAAIEAARAGEQGRGFAVVADEVRGLASRTQESTIEIQRMVETLQTGAADAVSVVSVGVKRGSATIEGASEAEQALQTILESVASILDMNTQIAAAVEEQSTVAEMISQSVVHITSLADDAELLGQENRNAAERITATGKGLDQLIRQFHL